MLIPEKDKDGHWLMSPRKSYRDPSKSFTSPDYSDPCSWFGDFTRITDEVMNTADNQTYTSSRTVDASWNHYWINWRKIPNHIRQSNPANMVLEVKLNDVVITSGFSVDYVYGTIVFDSANSGTDEVKVSYSYANSSRFDLIANVNKKLKLDYVEVQFSVDSSMPVDDAIFFESIYNGPAIASLGIPENVDVVLRRFEYWGYHDFLNESTGAMTCKTFMGMTKEVVILPWDYLTGHTIVPVGEAADLNSGEFHKLRVRMKNDGIVQNSEIATGTFYCIIDGD